MTTAQHPLYPAFEQALRVAMDRAHLESARVDAARATGAIADQMRDRPVEVDVRLRHLAAATLDAPEASAEVVRALVELDVRPQAPGTCEPLAGWLVPFSAAAADAGAGPALLQALLFLLSHARGDVRPEHVERCAELLADRPDDAVAELLVRWIQAPGFHASWVRAFLLAHPEVMLRAGTKRFRGLHQLAPLLESWTLEGDSAARCASRGWSVSPPPRSLEPQYYAGREAEALASLREAAAGREGTVAGTILHGWAQELQLAIEEYAPHGSPAERAHVLDPTTGSWRALAMLMSGVLPSRALDPLAYGDRAPLALAALTEALEQEPEGVVRACLGAWLSIFFAKVQEASPEAAAAQTFESMSDRGVRRLVGARTFLRGLDLERRGQVTLGEHTPRSARGRVGDLDVEVRLDAGRLEVRCTCQATQNVPAPCKHAAALIVALRTRLRGRRPGGEL